MLYILSISLDGKYPVFDYKFVFYFMYWIDIICEGHINVIA